MEALRYSYANCIGLLPARAPGGDDGDVVAEEGLAVALALHPELHLRRRHSVSVCVCMCLCLCACVCVCKLHAASLEPIHVWSPKIDF